MTGFRRASVGLVALGFVAAVFSEALARNGPIITISHHNLGPEKIEVHVGELVRWRAAGGHRLRLMLDAHPEAHPVIVRVAEIRAVFLEPGEHWYVGSVVTDSERGFRGVVVVRQPEVAPELPRVCGPGSSRLICIEP